MAETVTDTVAQSKVSYASTVDAPYFVDDDTADCGHLLVVVADDDGRVVESLFCTLAGPPHDVHVAHAGAEAAARWRSDGSLCEMGRGR